MRNFVVLAVLALIVSGCITFREACVGYGFRPGTDAFASCVQREAHHLDNALRSIRY